MPYLLNVTPFIYSLFPLKKKDNTFDNGRRMRCVGMNAVPLVNSTEMKPRDPGSASLTLIIPQIIKI